MIIDAWVIHKKSIGDTSSRVTFFTRDLGLITATCKGGRTPKKQAMLQPFTPLWIELYARRGFYFVNQIETQTATLNLTGSHLLAGWYLNEILPHALRFEDAAEEVYDAYTKSLQLLVLAQNTLDVERVLRKFEYILLQSMGYAMSWTHDADSALPIEANKFYELQVGRGFVLAKLGIPGEHLLAMTKFCLDDPAILASTKMIMRKALHHALDGVCLHTRNLYGDVWGAQQKGCKI